MLECINLIKTYAGKTVVKNLSFSVKKGEVFALLGSNGAGKTTTIKMILGFVKTDGGKIKTDENLHMGYSPETPYFPPFLTGKEVLCYYYKIQKLEKSLREKTITDLLILDEPTAGLDAMGRLEIIQLIGELKKAGVTMVINSHILNDIERVCDRGIILKEGECLREWRKGDEEKKLEDIFVETIGGRKKGKARLQNVESR